MTSKVAPFQFGDFGGTEFQFIASRPSAKLAGKVAEGQRAFESRDEGSSLASALLDVSTRGPLPSTATKTSRIPLSTKPTSPTTQRTQLQVISKADESDSDLSPPTSSLGCSIRVSTHDLNQRSGYETVSTFTQSQIEQWVRHEFRVRYHDINGKLHTIPQFFFFKLELDNLRPGHTEVIERTISDIEAEVANAPLSEKDSQDLFDLGQAEAARLSWTLLNNQASNRSAIITALSSKRPDIQREVLASIAQKIETLRVSRRREVVSQREEVRSQEVLRLQQNMATTRLPDTTLQEAPQLPWAPKAWPSFAQDLTDASFNRSTRKGLEAWVQWHYCKDAFKPDGAFKGFKWLRRYLVDLAGNVPASAIRDTIDRLRYEPQHEHSFPMLSDEGEGNTPLSREIRKIKRAEAAARLAVPAGNANASTFQSQIPSTVATATLAPTQSGPSARVTMLPTSQVQLVSGPSLATHTAAKPTITAEDPKDDLLARKLRQVHSATRPATNSSAPRQDDTSDSEDALGDADSDDFTPGSENDSDPVEFDRDTRPDFDAMDLLLIDRSIAEGGNDKAHAEIRHAPLFDEDFVRGRETKATLPQYGLMGTHDQNIENAKSKLFLNTNVPFSAFVCGVQGSGKSHTTSCILENCLIPSNNLGELQKPLSALVFSYGLFTGDGSGFSISEAAFLGSPNPRIGGAHVKNINVLVCATNYIRIARLYERLPNVTVTCFKLDPRNLDIDLMLTLMNVNESDRVPLYMAQVQNILRYMAMNNVSFDYNVFKQHIKNQKFDHVQQNMLDIRLAILESFLDLKGTHKEELLFRPGEVNIMDMSCPFVDANTACIMFKCGLQRYLQSGVAGKMIVLDEAHKYMLDVPGAKALNETLLQTIRLQRHFGARVIISTQEPTLLTDLIALCSVTIIHRFSSPEWFAAIKRHIRIPEKDKEALMERIEGLTTGSAVVYSPNAVLGFDVDNQLLKGTGQMMTVKMRRRITADGGQSVLAV
ncbi:hypothetical protein N0V90_008779 [Kalmusia sp. IMI 367209]|nr:hypothetical protein N0V90_008779 [Kalmusia sp. IMI 367209]